MIVLLKEIFNKMNDKEYISYAYLYRMRKALLQDEKLLTKVFLDEKIFPFKRYEKVITRALILLNNDNWVKQKAFLETNKDLVVKWK